MVLRHSSTKDKFPHHADSTSHWPNVPSFLWHFNTQQNAMKILRTNAPALRSDHMNFVIHCLLPSKFTFS